MAFQPLGADTETGELPEVVEQRIAAALSATYDRRLPTFDPTAYFPYGTSYTEGAGASTEATKYANLVAGAVGVFNGNGGVSGSTSAGLPYGYITRLPFTPGAHDGALVTIEHSINDVGTASASLRAAQYNFAEFLMTAMRWFRADHFVPFSDPSVDYSNMGGIAPITGGAADLNQAYANFAGASVEITPGGPEEIVLLLLAWRAGSASAENSDYEVRVDGGGWRKRTTKGRGDQWDGSPNVYTLVSERVTGLAPDSVVEIRKIGGGDGSHLRLMDRYLVMGNPNPPRIVLVPDVYVNDGSGPYPNNGTNAAIDAFTRRMEWIAQLPEFADGTVTVAQTNYLFDYVTMLDPDGLHPNDAGHAAIAKGVIQAVQQLR